MNRMQIMSMNPWPWRSHVCARYSGTCIITIILVALTMAADAMGCPDVCYCVGTVSVSVYCDFKELTQMPSKIPLETTHLYVHVHVGIPKVLSYNDEDADGSKQRTMHGINFRFLMGNKFEQVLPSMFRGTVRNSAGAFTSATAALTKLKVIRLDLNPIAVVNEHAFLPAPTLEMIYLPFDVKIQRQAFAEMKNDKITFDGYGRVPTHALEDPLFVAFSLSQSSS